MIRILGPRYIRISFLVEVSIRCLYFIFYIYSCKPYSKGWRSHCDSPTFVIISSVVIIAGRHPWFFPARVFHVKFVSPLCIYFHNKWYQSIGHQSTNHAATGVFGIGESIWSAAAAAAALVVRWSRRVADLPSSWPPCASTQEQQQCRVEAAREKQKSRRSNSVQSIQPAHSYRENKNNLPRDFRFLIRLIFSKWELLRPPKLVYQEIPWSTLRAHGKCTRGSRFC